MTVTPNSSTIYRTDLQERAVRTFDYIGYLFLGFCLDLTAARPVRVVVVVVVVVVVPGVVVVVVAAVAVVVVVVVVEGLY